MIFHLLRDAQIRIPSLAVSMHAEAVKPTTLQNFILFRDLAGGAVGYPDNRIDSIVSVLVRNSNSYLAKSWANSIFGTYRELFNIVLDANPLEGTGVENIRIARIASAQSPYSLGPDSAGYFGYTFNLIATFQSPVLV